MRTHGARLALLIALVAAPPREARADELAAIAQEVAARPWDMTLREAYARAAITAGRPAEAIASLTDAVARVPGFRRGYYLLGVAHRAHGDPATAASYFRSCVAMGQQPEDARFGLGRALLDMGDRAGAARALTEYVAREHDPAKARFVAEAKRLLADLPPLPDEDALQPPAFERGEGRPPGAAPDRDDLMGPADPELAAARPDAAPVAPAGQGREPARPPRRLLRDLQDPFADEDRRREPEPAPADASTPGGATNMPAPLRAYLVAVGAYRRALAAQSERFADGYEQGVGAALAGRYREAQAAWDRLLLDDVAVVEARRRVEQARAAAGIPKAGVSAPRPPKPRGR